MKAFGRLVRIIVGMVLGIILTVGGTVGAGYTLLTKPGMVGYIDDKIGDNIPDLVLSDEMRAMSLIDYGKGIYAKLQNPSTATIGEIEEAIGYAALSGTISTSLGIDAAEIRASTLAGLSDCIVNSLRVRTLSEHFGVEYPEFPLFEDEAFLDSRVTEAFSSLGDKPLDSFITVVYDSDPDTSKPRSSKFVQKLGVVGMDELSGDLDAILEDSTIGELITIDETSEPILNALKEVKLNSEDMNNAIAELTVADVFENYDSGVISLVPSDTLLSGIATTLTGVISGSNLYRLMQLGVFSADLSSSTPKSKASFYNKTPNGILDNYIKILNDPANAVNLTKPQEHSVSGQLTQDVIDELANFRNGDIIKLTADATIPADTVFTSVFNIEVDGNTLTIGMGVAIDSFGGYMYIKGYTGAATIASLQTIRKTPTITVDSVEIVFIP